MFLWLYHSFSCDFSSLNSFMSQLLYDHDYKSSFLVWLQQQSGGHSNVFCLWNISVGNKGLVTIFLNNEKLYFKKEEKMTDLFSVLFPEDPVVLLETVRKILFRFFVQQLPFCYHSKNLNVMVTFLVQYNTCYYHLQVLGKLQFSYDNENTLLHVLLVPPIEVKMSLLKCLTKSQHPNGFL